VPFVISFFIFISKSLQFVVYNKTFVLEHNSLVLHISFNPHWHSIYLTARPEFSKVFRHFQFLQNFMYIMAFRKAVRCFLIIFLVVLLAGGHPVAAGPGGYVTLINGSPYDWKLVCSHENQMHWKPAPIIPAGTSKEQYFEYWHDWGNNRDCGAEVTYELVGSPMPASFQLQARQSGGKGIQVQFQGDH
jgi:hypothetical protein